MGLKEQLKTDLKEAMKSKDTLKRDVIRLINSAIKQIEVDERRELSESDILKILKKAAKQRKESIAQFKEASRDDLVEKEEQELKIIEQYLPEELSDEQLKSELKRIIEEVGATTMKDMGKVMGIATKTLNGDGKKINGFVKELLS